MSKNKRTWHYSGPVMRFDNCIEQSWSADTWAVSKSKAMNNLIYRYKQDHDLAPGVKITLPGRLIEVE